MENFINFINKYGLLIVLFLSLITFFKSCTTSQVLKNHVEYSDVQVHKIDTVLKVINANALTKNDIIMVNNDLMKEYNLLVFGILNNKISSDELTKRLKEIENSLIRIKNNNEKKSK